MPCYHPLEGYRSASVNPKTGKRSLVFNPRQAEDANPAVLKVPCGQCIGCRLERSRQWAIRCVHEAELYENNCFITLTYSEDNLPQYGNLTMKDYQDFMKRLRKRYGSGVRYFHCGEYGEKFGRPHYHACLFNFDFPDKKIWRETPQGHPIWTSEALSELWPHGHHEIGAVTFESAAYVARYITKKITGKKAETHYEFLDEFGEYRQRNPEYVTMSRRPGIGKGWLEKFGTDVYPNDAVIVREREMRPPKYYDRCYELVDPFMMDDVKFHRVEKGKLFAENSTFERLCAREIVQIKKLESLKRSYENGT